MAEKLLMLALSPTMEEGILVQWRKKEGDTIESGEAICDVETDKAVMEYQAMNTGTLLKILLPEGRRARVGDPIGIIGAAGEDVSELLSGTDGGQPAKKAEKPQPPAEATAAPEPEYEPAAGTETVAEPITSSPKVMRSSPVARRLAEKHGIDLRTISGSGPQGRIVERDVQQFVARGVTAGAAPKPVEKIIKVSEKRRIIAQRLSESKFSAPHYYLKVTALVDALLNERQRYNKNAPEKISLNAYLIKFAAETLKNHPLVNATWQGDTIIQHGAIDIALAVAQPEGLITPVVRHCGTKSIIAIDRELKELIDKAQKGTLTPEEYSNSTFTITNLGSYGIEEFTAIINPPNAAILAVGKAYKQPLADDSGAISVRTTMKLILSCDHRLVDGVTGAAFLTDLKGMIEYPVQFYYGIREHI